MHVSAFRKIKIHACTHETTRVCRLTFGWFVPYVHVHTYVAITYICNKLFKTQGYSCILLLLHHLVANHFCARRLLNRDYKCPL